MRIDILTLFPEMFVPLKSSILSRAEKNGKIEINLINFRDFSLDKHKKVDDKPFGGGDGMLLAVQPIFDAINRLDPKRTAHRVYMSPKGEVFTQEKAKFMAEKYEHIIILCGHYEGVDQRVIELCIDEEISIGNFVLTGGEIPAMAVADAILRLSEGVILEDSFKNESHYSGYLEEPQYTRPQEFMGLKVPEVLVSGNHAEIEKWRKQNRKKIK